LTLIAKGCRFPLVILKNINHRGAPLGTKSLDLIPLVTGTRVISTAKEVAQLLQNDGDMVRGLGFVALYAAYLEEQIDNLLMMLAPIEAYDEEKQRWPVSKKLRHVTRVLRKLDAEEFPDLATDLRTCLDLFEDRNELIHGRIYGNFDRPDTLKSGRLNTPDREVNPEELYKLANEFSDFRESIYRPMIFKIPRAIANT
jgi:hypothetical protein